MRYCVVLASLALTGAMATGSALAVSPTSICSITVQTPKDKPLVFVPQPSCKSRIRVTGSIVAPGGISAWNLPKGVRISIYDTTRPDKKAIVVGPTSDECVLANPEVQKLEAEFKSTLGTNGYFLTDDVREIRLSTLRKGTTIVLYEDCDASGTGVLPNNEVVTIKVK